MRTKLYNVCFFILLTVISAATNSYADDIIRLSCEYSDNCEFGSHHYDKDYPISINLTTAKANVGNFSKEFYTTITEEAFTIKFDNDNHNISISRSTGALYWPFDMCSARGRCKKVEKMF